MEEQTKEYIFELLFNEPTYRFSKPIRQANIRRKALQLRAMYNSDPEFFNTKYSATNYAGVINNLFKRFKDEEE